MTSKERIEAVLERRVPDRLPADIWMTGEVFASLQQYLGLQDERDIYERLGVDKIWWVSADYLGPRQERRFSDEIVNEWGACYRPRPYEYGIYLENSRYPLAEAQSEREIDQYPWPDSERYDYDSMKSKASRYPDGMLMVNTLSLFETYSSLRGLDNALMDLYINKELLHRALGRIADVQYAYMDRALFCLPEASLVYFSDDMGMQDRCLFSPELWDEFLLEPTARLIDLVHRQGKKVFYHSDGSAFEILSRLVDIGIDIVNPIQYVCPGMERERLKSQWGQKVIFHGAIENQRVLPFGTPAQVRQEVFDCIRILGEGGGYIPAPCHNIQPNTPCENIVALYDAVREANETFLR